MPHRNDPIVIPTDLPEDIVKKIHKEGLVAFRIAVGGWALLGLIAMLAGARYFAEGPEASSVVSQELNGPFDEAWSVTWIISGILILYGVLKPHWIAELYGQIFFFFSLVPYNVAVFDSAGLVIGFYLAVAIAGASLVRIWYLNRYAGRLGFVIEPESSGKYGRRKDDAARIMDD